MFLVGDYSTELVDLANHRQAIELAKPMTKKEKIGDLREHMKARKMYMDF